jgi:hypothetical protein
MQSWTETVASAFAEALSNSQTHRSAETKTVEMCHAAAVEMGLRPQEAAQVREMLFGMLEKGPTARAHISNELKSRVGKRAREETAPPHTKRTIFRPSASLSPAETGGPETNGDPQSQQGNEQTPQRSQQEPFCAQPIQENPQQVAKDANEQRGSEETQPREQQSPQNQQP